MGNVKWCSDILPIQGSEEDAQAPPTHTKVNVIGMRSGKWVLRDEYVKDLLSEDKKLKIISTYQGKGGHAGIILFIKL